MNEVVITSYARTPLGSFQGALSSLPAPRLGAAAIKAAMERSHIKPEQVSEVIMGNVLSAGIGQAPCRQAALYAAIPDSTPCLTINKVCGSGMKAVMLAMQAILTGDAEILVAGGMENMSQSPYLSKECRSGFRMGHHQVIDSMILDGLWDPYNNQHMGNCAELCAKEKKISRQEQDAYAIDSFRRAQKAQAEGKFSKEISPIEIPNPKGNPTRVESDEGPSKVVFEKVPILKPVFDKEGTVTAANSSTINDGAAALVLMSSQRAQQLGCKPIARIIAHSNHAQAPQYFTTAPIAAIQKVLQKANWKLDQVDLFEINEAFAVVALAAQKELGIPHDKLNVWGGAVALGHPIGASGARILCTLLSALQDRHKKRGIASICLGGGEATALCVELIA